MCWLCDHPNATRDDYAGVLRTKMLKNGWAVQYVESEPTPWAYTIGLHDWGQPELLVTGVSPPRACRLLNKVTGDALRGLALAPGEQIRVPDGPLVEIVEVDHPDVHMGWAIRWVVPTYGRFSWCGPTAVAAGHGPRRSATVDVGSPCWECGLRTRSGGTGPCSATTAPVTSRWPSAGSTRPRLERSRSRTGTPRPAAAPPAPPGGCPRHC